MRYDFASIESRWQQHWAEHKTFRAPNPGEAGFDPDKPKFYVLDMFPYPSGVGLHVGHPLGYIATDIVARYKRMRGYNVLHPMGYDAFGLPAEQFAVEHGVHPAITTQRNIDNMTRQLKRLGLSYDWDRCLSTTDVGYYKWTQWIFLQMFNAWFDPAVNAARPIADLEQALLTGQYLVGLDGELISAGASEGLEPIEGLPPNQRKFTELSPLERRQTIDNQRLAYMAEVPVNWCPALGTVLANEEVTADGRSERGNHPVYKRPLKQWMLRITAFAPRLEEDLALVDWPEPIKIMQRNWIGRSTGARVDFALDPPNDDEVITVFTTRPDTLFGATYMVLAPEHPLVDAITTSEAYHAVSEYRQRVSGMTEADRTAEGKAKTGVFTGAYAINPVNAARIPVWIADYVMMGYGTGAIMAVPAHDRRDHEFALAFGLPIVQVVTAPQGHDVQEEAWEGDGVGVNSANRGVSLNGQSVDEAKRRITDWLRGKGLGEATVQYKLRDWLFSRQRYWGEPFPVLHGPDGQVVALDESELPVELPPMEDFKPQASDDPAAPPTPPLGRAPDEWKSVERDGVRYTREFNTMPQWAGSCWYYLRFCDPGNGGAFAGREAERYWMGRSGHSASSSPGVDLYVGGAEHAVLHLLYARFWHKVLFDLGHVSTPEPFGKLFNQGYIQAHAYTDPRGVYVPAAEVVEKDGQCFYDGQPVKQEFGKMGKSLKNAITPDEICEQYGCDTMRLYEMYLGPLDQSKVWRTRDILGVHRFLQRLWRNFIDEETGALRVSDDGPAPAQAKLLHKTIKKVTDDIDRMSFNTAIAALIEMNNELVGSASLPRELAEKMSLLLAPLAPHVAEELWSRLGHERSLSHEPWPSFDEKLLVEDTVEYPVQVNGKLRGKVTVPADADDKAVIEAAMNDEKVKPLVEGKTLRKAIVVKGKMVNLVVG